ncbi:MAG TPA: elongation factor P [Planctomycetota bacterium]|jgi:elongation factor P|nr:elongation factor P [Planctomycetota bacterium]
MSTKATELRKGMVIEKEGDLLLITDYSHATPGNWRAIIQIKTRSLLSGQTGQFRPAAGDPFDVAFLDKKRCEYLYKESNGDFVFMDAESYEQFPLSDDLVGEAMNFVRENASVEITFHDATPIGVELPSTVVLTVAEAEMAVKGNTASNTKKDAVLETGYKIRVPLHIVAGEEIKVKTETGEFHGRAKS